MATGTRKPGEFCWINLLTPEPEAAREFFGKLRRWEYGEIPGMGHLVKVGGRPIGGLFDLAGQNTPPGTPPAMPEFTYTSFKLDGEYVAGMMPILPRMGEIPSHWGVYFTVEDADETARLAGELGAKVFIPVQDIPGVGRFCGIFSPQGVMFYAMSYNA